MNPLVRSFRQIAAQACSARHAFRHFMADGLEDVLDEAEAGGWSAVEIATQVLARCCVEERRFNNQQARFLAVVMYLNEQQGALGQGEQQAFRDLLAVLNSGGAVDAIRGWMRTHYP